MTAFEAVQCPRCESPLNKRKAPFYLHGELIGSFESLVCDMCHFSALTSQGYQEATVEAEKFGLIGPAESILTKVKITESMTEVESKFAISPISVSNGMQQVLVRPGEKAKSRRLAQTIYEIPTSTQN